MAATNPGVFANAFMNTQWALISRAESVDTLAFTAMKAKDDTIAIRFNQTKSDQEGVKHTDDKHCYANPQAPERCLFLSLAIYFIINNNIDGDEVFPGKNQQ